MPFSDWRWWFGIRASASAAKLYSVPLEKSSASQSRPLVGVKTWLAMEQFLPIGCNNRCVIELKTLNNRNVFSLDPLASDAIPIEYRVMWCDELTGVVVSVLRSINRVREFFFVLSELRKRRWNKSAPTMHAREIFVWLPCATVWATIATQEEKTQN